MTAAKASSARRSLLVMVGLVAVVILTFGVWWLRRDPTRHPPHVDTSGADVEVAELIDASRREVLADPRSGGRWGRLGTVLRAHGFGDEANECFEEAERLDPREAAWPYYRGLTLVLTDPEAGLTCLRRAVERMDASEVMPRYRLVEVLLEQGQFDEAERDLGQVKERSTADLRGQLLRARLALARQDSKRALAALTGCWDDRRTRRQAHLLAAEAWQRLDDPAKATEYQKTAAGLPADLPWTDPYVEEVERLRVGSRDTLGLVGKLRQQGRTEESLQLLQDLTREKPRDPGVWVLLGQLHQQRRDFASAKQAYQRAVELDPKNLDGWFGLGLVRVDREPRKAADALIEVIRLKPDHTVAHYLRGICLKNLGERGEAREAFQQALRCQPDHEPTRKALAELERDDEKKR